MIDSPSAELRSDAIPGQAYPLKILDLLPFGGAPETWPGFVTSHVEMTKAFKYTDLVNMYRLQKSQSKEAVVNMLIYPQNVDDVMVESALRFGRP